MQYKSLHLNYMSILDTGVRADVHYVISHHCREKG